MHAPIEPMLAAPVEALPEGSDWAYEPKWDGWRAIAFCRTGGVHLQSRSARPLSTYFPDITRIVRASVPAGVVLDGELIVWERERTNFALLQRRVTAGRQVLRMARDHPAHYVVFDLLRGVDGRELLDVPLSERRARLVDLLADAPAQLALSPQTTDLAEAQEWLSTWTAAGVEGVMAKRLGSRYEPGRRGSWLKLRARLSTEAIIGGVTGTLQDPDTLLVGRLDQQGRLRYTGRTHPLSARQRRELAPLLTPFGQGRSRSGKHPWPQPLPPAWSGQLDKPNQLPYVQVDPTVVVEIEVDTAFEHNRWRHRVRYVQPRLDMSIYDVPLLLPWPGAGGESRTVGPNRRAS